MGFARRALQRFAFAAVLLTAGTAVAGQPVISIIIDDMGDRAHEGLRVINLPGPVAVAILPATPHGNQQARMARAAGKEILLHFPLEPQAGKAHPLAVTTRSTRDELNMRLASGLNQLPYVDGVNIHQGSLLSQRTDYMNWMMEAIRDRGLLYFVDSYTSGRSVAYPVAEQWRLPAARRQVFLDAERGAENVRKEFGKLIAIARRNGSALAIGHPFPETIALLEAELPQLARYQVRLVAPSELIELQQGLKPAPAAPRSTPRRPLRLQLTSTMSIATIATGPLPQGSH